MNNINMLRDEDNDAGFYAVACGSDSTKTWRGAALMRSVDGGSSYAKIVDVTGPSTIGETTNALGNFQGGNIVDELNTINVSLAFGELSSTTLSGLLSGVNTAIVGDEIIGFREAALQVDGSYILRGLLRGKRGSEYAMASHAIGDRFVLVSPDRMMRVPQSSSDIGMERSYKMVSYGLAVSSVPAANFTNAGAGLKPYAPVQLGGGRDASGNVTLQWVRRNRISGEWRDGVDVPMSEAAEQYEVEIWNSGFTTLKRTISGLTTPQATYPAADQTADFGGLQSTVYFKVYQLSAIVGRGYAASGSV